MTDWTPDTYLTFADHRLRPALDLLARIPMDAPRRIVDLGCGTGALTRHLAARWPNAEITGLDTSAEMLSRAQAEDGGKTITWVQGDIATWTPDDQGSPDLITSNAALHWLDGHDVLFPRLLDALAPGGVLAVQMPRNHDRPSHALIRAVAKEGPWEPLLAALVAAPPPVDPPEVTVRRLLAAGAATVDAWETDYQQILAGGPDAVAAFTDSTALRPWLARLPDATMRDAFRAAYRGRLATAYESLPNGRVLFPFRRQFLVATRPHAESP
ncbi:methyltransferase domain-containing protein [Roseospira visakhapatnamensis]|uniref:Trans-aconitate 2-methyltransferase n=1 Tax=Roseospira visakhapatnamensis TaxID=390880 RepID=A0A7W6WAB2_9PROT|nr:methyltransferase domain-containing protein [Roseospira visakhapatnamensis]MBB4267020.1 trans-aconitate 2-methyltransferase [Roseospira visakhapatnamensis]